MTDTKNPKPADDEGGHTKYAVECDPKKPLDPKEKTAGEGCGNCGGGHDDVEGGEEK